MGVAQRELQKLVVRDFNKFVERCALDRIYNTYVSKANSSVSTPPFLQEIASLAVFILGGTRKKLITPVLEQFVFNK